MHPFNIARHLKCPPTYFKTRPVLVNAPDFFQSIFSFEMASSPSAV